MLWSRMEHESLEGGHPDLLSAIFSGLPLGQVQSRIYQRKRRKGGSCQIAEYQVEEFAFHLIGSRDRLIKKMDP